MTNQHTPGPWTCNYGNGSNLSHDLTVWGNNGRAVVAEIAEDASYPVAQNERVVNARLIAAAPDLLAALVKVTRDLKYAYGGHGQMPPMEAALCAQAHTAITKAGGAS